MSPRGSESTSQPLPLRPHFALLSRVA
jgi:hypothetical protein